MEGGVKAPVLSNGVYLTNKLNFVIVNTSLFGKEYRMCVNLFKLNQLHRLYPSDVIEMAELYKRKDRKSFVP